MDKLYLLMEMITGLFESNMRYDSVTTFIASILSVENCVIGEEYCGQGYHFRRVMWIILV